MTRDTEDVVDRRAAIRDILYRLLPQEIDANICRAVADEFLALEASDRQSLSDRIDRLEGAIGKARIQISGGLCYFSAEAKHAQLADADRTLADALGEKSLTDAVIVRAALHQEGIAPPRL